MIKYTSVEISRCLAEAGFEVTPPDAMWGIDPITKEWRIDTWYYTTNERRAYRSDTLLTWLLSLDSKEVAAKMGVRTLAENGDRGCLRVEQARIDSKGTLAYVVQLYRPIEMGSQGPVLADALGLLVCRVMKEMEAKP
jgi:hypothetical protein